MSTLALTAPSTQWSIGSRWVGAHVAGQAICIATAAIAYGIATLIGANDPAAGAMLKNVALGLAIATELAYAFAITAMRGAVLRQVLPAFPIRLWIVVMVGAMMTLHFLSGASSIGQTTARAAPQMTMQLLLIGTLMTAIAAFIMGLLIGTIEALVLRRAADGVIFWALMTGTAWSAGTVVMMAAGGAMLMYPGLPPAMTAVLGGALKLVTGAILGLLTLPALKQLRPRAGAAG